MRRTLAQWAGSLALLVGLSGLSLPAFADPIYLEHHHGYESGSYVYGAWRGHDHDYYSAGYGGPVYAVPVYRHHHHCQDVVVHTWHGHHLRRVCR